MARRVLLLRQLIAGSVLVGAPVAVVTGTASVASAAPELTLTQPADATLNFGDTQVDTSAVLPVTIQNTGDQPLSLTGAEIDGPFDFVEAPDLAPVEPGASREFQVEFRPPSVGTHTGGFVLDFLEDFPGELVIAVQGVGVSQVGTTTTTNTSTPVTATPTTPDDDLATTGANDGTFAAAAMLLVAAGSLILATHPRRLRRP